MAQKKKDFSAVLNPVAQFITMQADEATPQTKSEATPPPGYRVDPRYVETKSRRVQLLIKPSLHAKVKARAQEEKRSVNDMVNLLLEEALGDNR